LGGPRIAGSHSTFLQIGLSAGWAGLLLFLFLLYEVFYSLKSSKNQSWEWLSLASANLGMLVMFLFDDRLFNPWVWIIISLAIAYSYLQKEESEFLDVTN